MNTPIKNLLIDWGQTQRQLPPNNTALKNQLLAKLNIPSVPTAPRKIFQMPWLSLAFSSLAVVVLLLQTGMVNRFASIPTKQGQFTNSATQGLASQNQSSQNNLKISESPLSAVPFAEQNDSARNIYAPPILSRPEVPITDNREFLKTDYNAGVKTRHVLELTQQLQTVIRGFGGRVDSANSYTNSGFISFAVPAGRFDAFKLEVKNLAGAKFYVESQSSQNLLPEKQSIEQQQTQLSDTLNQLQTNRQNLIDSHIKNAASIKSQLNSVAKKLSDLDSALPPWSAEYQNQQQELYRQRTSLQKRLADENTNYSNQLSSFDAQIQNTNANLNNLNGQNQNLLDNVATVSGTISLESINFLQVINAYFSLYWIALILFAAAAISYIARRGNRPILP